MDSAERLKRMPCTRQHCRKHMKASRKSLRSKEINRTPTTTKPVVSRVINMTQNFEHLCLASFFFFTTKVNLQSQYLDNCYESFYPVLFCYTPCTSLHTMTCRVPISSEFRERVGEKDRVVRKRCQTESRSC